MAPIRSLHLPVGLLPTAALLLSALTQVGSREAAWGLDNTAYTWDATGADFADQRNVVAQRGAKDQVIFGRSSFAANRALLDNWYRHYLFPSMAAEEGLGELYDKRDNLMKDLENASDPALHQYLLDVAYEEAARRATGNYHPYVRYNAMLIVGGLNQSEARMLGGLRYPAVRFPRAFDFMVDELQRPDQADVVRIAAMLGVERHLRLVRQRPQDQPIPDGRRAEVAALMHGLVDEKAVPASRNVDGHTWLRRSAVDVLAALGAVGDNHAIFDSLVRIVGDAAEPLSLRCAAARALGDLVYTDVAGIDAVAAVRELAALGAYACRAEDVRAKEEQKVVEERTAVARSGGMPGMSGMPGRDRMDMPSRMNEEMMMPGRRGDSAMGPGGLYGMYGSGARVDEETEELTDRVRRRLKLPLHCVLLGIRGPQVGRAPTDVMGAVAQLAADDQQKAEVARIVKALDAVVVATDSHERGLAEMLKEVRTKARDLEGLLPNKTAASNTPLPNEETLPGAGPPAN